MLEEVGFLRLAECHHVALSSTIDQEEKECGSRLEVVLGECIRYSVTLTHGGTVVRHGVCLPSLLITTDVFSLVS